MSGVEGQVMGVRCAGGKKFEVLAAAFFLLKLFVQTRHTPGDS